MNYSIPRPNTRAKRACTEESLNYVEHVVVHTKKLGCTLLDCPLALPNIVGGIQANICTLCNAKVGIGKHGNLFQHTKV